MQCKDCQQPPRAGLCADGPNDQAAGTHLRPEEDPMPVPPDKAPLPAGDQTQSPSISIQLNGEPRQFQAGITVGGLIAQLGYAPGSVAVERNREVVPRRAHNETALQAGDEVELVTFVGGG